MILFRYIPERHQYLGPDLATAHFIVFRGGSVKFHKGKKWVKKNEEDEYDLPDKKVEGLHLKAIDASGMNLHYVALDNLVHLDHLKWLSLADCQNVDDWYLDTISGEFEGLEYLDISGCKKVTHLGIAILGRLTNLKELHLNNMTDSVEYKLACLSLEELLPELKLHGINYNESVPAEERVLQ